MTRITYRNPDGEVISGVPFRSLPWLKQGAIEIKPSDAVFDHASGKIRIRYDLTDTASFQAFWMPGEKQPMEAV